MKERQARLKVSATSEAVHHGNGYLIICRVTRVSHAKNAIEGSDDVFICIRL